ncbi:MAG: hypothetical protein JWR69_650 [Pedosphaera sp.]|nr:hypothetical protein [Pedosphaera sp.]
MVGFPHQNQPLPSIVHRMERRPYHKPSDNIKS